MRECLIQTLSWLPELVVGFGFPYGPVFASYRTILLMPTAPPLDPLPFLTCPLCGRGNECAVSTGGVAADCWCMHTSFSTTARTALAALPDGLQGQVCICPACAAGAAPEATDRAPI